MVHIDFQRELPFPAERVWALLEDFGNMQWAPGIQRVELLGEGIGMTRRLHMDGMDPIDEVLEAQDAETMSYQYSIPRGIPLPVTDYLASARIEPLDGERCRAYWSCQCRPADPGVSEQDLETMMHSTYQMLLDMVEAFLAKQDDEAGE